MLNLVKTPDQSQAAIKRIHDAFPIDDVPIRKDLFLEDSIDFDNDHLPEQWGGKRWDEINEQFLDQMENSFGYLYFAPGAFVYYLAALLIGAVHCQSNAESIFMDELILNLWPFMHANRGKGNNRDLQRWQRLTREHREAIASTLECCVEIPVGEDEAKQQKKIQKLIDLMRG